jgi:hypothetical protein
MSMKTWVSVADRLPDDDTTVLIVIATTFEVWMGYHSGDDGWLSVDAIPTPVAYWQPLPEPPEYTDSRRLA